MCASGYGCGYVTLYFCYTTECHCVMQIDQSGLSLEDPYYYLNEYSNYSNVTSVRFSSKAFLSCLYTH